MNKTLFNLLLELQCNIFIVILILGIHFAHYYGIINKIYLFIFIKRVIIDTSRVKKKKNLQIIYIKRDKERSKEIKERPDKELLV